MDCLEVKVENPEDEQLEALFIVEEGDDFEHVVNNTEKGKGAQRSDEDDREDVGEITDTVEEDRIEKNNKKDDKNSGEEAESLVKKMDEEITDTEERTTEECSDKTGESGREVEKEKREEERESERQDEHEVKEGSEEVEAPGERTEGRTVKKMDIKNQDTLTAQDTESSVKLRPKDRLSPEDAQTKVHRVSPEFSDAFCDLLYTLQEGRRLNDQRCSFRMEARRRCYSEPSTPRHSQRVVFSSMTSLQKEEFFDLVATSQARRLDDQRAELQSVPSASPPPQPKVKQRRSSCKESEVKKAVPTAPPKEDLYNMILTSQAQGRLEEQRSVPPGPMDDEDFFSLLLRVQGGRMDEQRTELPVALKY
ncbi:G-protein-signaling modulator 1 [Chanos chanos]|uniref:G-protein-signaling modulator 1 n=1 Tax=Chanos chanos TaxID=29144 RepID=A0A6J2WA01_CHACN|nr:G-protein-signaling modulator 1-like [Chanos chanos]